MTGARGRAEHVAVSALKQELATICRVMRHAGPMPETSWLNFLASVAPRAEAVSLRNRILCNE
jgi:hypothetical protein